MEKFIRFVGKPLTYMICAGCLKYALIQCSRSHHNNKWRQERIEAQKARIRAMDEIYYYQEYLKSLNELCDAMEESDSIMLGVIDTDSIMPGGVDALDVAVADVDTIMSDPV